MSRLDALPADQKATLQLLLKQGKSYDELAALLRLDAAAVRERALDALDALGPDTPAGLPAARQDELADYLLGQQGASARAATRDFLESSAGARAWARVVSGELRAGDLVGPDGLPEIPAEGAEVEEAFEALDARREAAVQRERSSRLGGLLLLAGVGILVAIALIWLIGRGNDNDADKGAGTPPAQTATQTTSTNATANPVEQQINLTSPSGGKAIAVAYVLREDDHRALGIVGQHFSTTQGKDFNYVVWLKGPSRTTRLGFVNQGVGKDGNLTTGADPGAIKDKQDAAALRRTLDGLYGYDQLIVSRETSRDPEQPTDVVVSGDITRPSGQ